MKAFEILKHLFQSFPLPLQKHILMHGLFSVLFILLAIILYCYGPDPYILIPPIAISIFAIVRGIFLFRRVARGEYRIVEGPCIDTDVTMIRKRIKSLVFETEGRKVKVLVKQRKNKIAIGCLVRLYVANNTMVYEKDGYYVLYEYLDIDFPVEVHSKTDPNQSD